MNKLMPNEIEQSGIQATLFKPHIPSLLAMSENEWKAWKSCGHDITANYHKGDPQSVAANRRVDKVSQRKRVLDAIALWGEATCDRIEIETRLSHQSCSARISELKRDGKIVKVGTAPTRSGCAAALYKIV